MKWHLTEITKINLISGAIPGQDAVFEFRTITDGFCSVGTYDGTTIEVGDWIIDEPDVYEILEGKILSAIATLEHRPWMQQTQE